MSRLIARTQISKLFTPTCRPLKAIASSIAPSVRDITNAINGLNLNGTETDFRDSLREMSRSILNRLDMASLTRDQRRMVDEERVRRRRSQQQANPNAPGAVSQAIRLEGLGVRLEDDEPVPTARNQASEQTTSPQHSPTATGPPQNGRSPSKKKKAKNEPPKPWYLYQEYHQLISQEVPGISFNPIDIEGDDKYIKNIVGSFRCSNTQCKNKWTSGIVATAIRRYGMENFSYNARVYNQRCLRCQELGFMKINKEAYIKRISRHLKIWKGENVPKIYFPRGKQKGPHEEEHCEGCKVGECPWKDETSEPSEYET